MTPFTRSGNLGRWSGVKLQAVLGLVVLTILSVSCLASNPSGAASSGNASPSLAPSGASASPKTNPATMVKTGAGYEYWLAVGPGGPQAAVEITASQDAAGSGTLPAALPAAPPGKEYIYVPIQVTNRTDRPEPIYNVFVEGLDFAYLQLMVPFREFAQFGKTPQFGEPANFCTSSLTDTGVPSDPSSDCVLPSGFAQYLCTNPDVQSCPPPTGTGNVEVGKTTTIWLYLGGVPASAPATDVHVYFVTGFVNGQDVGKTTIIRIN